MNFLDAGAHITTEGSDGVHFTPENNRVLGGVMAQKVLEILA
ncbi:MULTISPECIES: hypothetical protein [unclassified Asaia]|nr:hypothetical protein [Asaia sp. W19]